MGKENKNFSFVPMMLEIGFNISIPLVFFVVLGVWLDKQFRTSPTFLFAGIFLSLFSSSMAIYDVYKKIRDDDNRKEE